MNALRPAFNNALSARYAGAATPHQRLYMRTLMDRLDLALDRITLLHRPIFEAAGLPAREPGRQVDAVLCELTKAEASALIEVLKQRTHVP